MSTGSTQSTRSTLLSGMQFASPRGGVVGCLGASVDQFLAPRVVFWPLRQPSLAEEVFVVEAEFFETCSGDVGQLEFGLLRGTGGAAA